MQPTAAWEQFISTGELAPGTLAPELEASWRRCRAAGVDPFAGKATARLTEAAFQELARRKQDLIRVAQPFMENLFNLVRGSSFVVLLFDERGYLLTTVGHPDRILAFQELDLNPGAHWAEAQVGTNGAGTALRLGHPVQVSGTEHYCRKHHPYTCSGAPILGPDGSLIGLLDMSGPVAETHPHTLGLVMVAVAAIQHALELGRKNLELTLLNNSLSSILATVTDGVLVLDLEGTLSQANPQAERMLAPAGRPLAGTNIKDLAGDAKAIRELLVWGREFQDRELELKAGPGTLQCLASGKPILDEAGASCGAVLFVNPIHKVKRLVNRFIGAQAIFRFEDILGSSQALRKAVQLGQQAAANDSNVLLTGESGTGKEMFAQAIHNHSSRRGEPFVAVNCGAIPRELIASELFGYQEGAFTGAMRGGRPGKFELASGGTLFLDEIGDMPLQQQIALLRVLQDHAITRVGGDRSFVVDVRIVCATNRDLQEEILKGTFRQDLYYRLNVSRIKLPALRERAEDLPGLLTAFLRKFAASKGAPAPRLEPAVVRALQNYPWPGNIREFQNVIERMAHAVTDGVVTLEQVPEEILGTPAGSGPVPAAAEPVKLRERLAEEQRREILACVRACKGNITKAAQELGMARNTLYRKLQLFEVDHGSTQTQPPGR